MPEKKEKYYIPVCIVTDNQGRKERIERFSKAWDRTIELDTTVTGKWVKMRECTKEEYFAG